MGGKDRRAAAAVGHARLHGDLARFHRAEAEKYAAKADALEAAGKDRAAKRQRDVAARNVRLAEEHQRKADAGLPGSPRNS